jgi:hypothetical protein
MVMIGKFAKTGVRQTPLPKGPAHTRHQYQPNGYRLGASYFSVDMPIDAKAPSGAALLVKRQLLFFPFYFFFHCCAFIATGRLFGGFNRFRRSAFFPCLVF